MKSLIVFALFASSMLTSVADADDQSSQSTFTAKPEDSGAISVKAPSDNANSRSDIDEEITNARLRATTGAKSLFSFQSSFNYNGSSINEPLAQTRPQLSPGTVENDPAKLQGLVSMKYRATDHDNINVGVGVGWLTPSYDGQRGQIEDPYVAYGRVFRVGSVQNVLNVAMTKYTAQSSSNKGLTYESDIDHTFLTSIGKSHLQLGINLAWLHEFYSSDMAGQQEDTLAAYPFGEYELTDRVSLRTVYRGLTYYSSQDQATTFVHDASTQSFGVGVSVTRDIYLYPNVQWVWEDIRSDKTNVALSANINL